MQPRWAQETAVKQEARRTALAFLLTLGVVSLLADATYEGARSATGPFLALLGASATIVGLAAGAGELLGYGLRLASGYVADRTGHYWGVTVVGYAINMLAVPALALAGRWEVAVALMMAERVGKAIRTPPRDAMLSHAAQRVGRGWGFGVHEALDQVGAVLGPLLVAGVLSVRGDYRASFAVLLAPALLALAVLALARRQYPHPRAFEAAPATLEPRGLPQLFWVYLAGVACIAAGYADFPLIAFHLKKAAVAPDSLVPVLYAVAMGVDALAALLCGRLFDRLGVGVLLAPVLLAAGFAPLVFLGGLPLAVAGVALWGAGMGAQESVMRAAVAEMVPAARRGTAYGVFNTGYGLFWFLGSALMGVLYDFSLPYLIAFSIVAQVAAVPSIFMVRSRLRRT